MSICQNIRRWDYLAVCGCALSISLVFFIHSSSHNSMQAVQVVDRSEDGGEGNI